MGGSNSNDKKGRAPRRDGQDLEYYKMVQERERRDQARYKEISNQKGTSLHNLKQRESLSKSQGEQLACQEKPQTITASSGQSFNLVKKMPPKPEQRPERVTNSPSYKTYEWMRCFLGDMEKIPGGTFYGEKLRDQIYRMLDGMNYRLDPTVYVNSYISKVYQDAPVRTGTMSSGSSMVSGQHSFNQSQSDVKARGCSLAQVYSSDMKGEQQSAMHKSSGIGSFYDGSSLAGSVIQQQDIIDADDDIAGLSVAGVNQSFKTKFVVLRYHLEKMKDHPLMRIIQVFRDELVSFIKQKQKDIKESVSFVESKVDKENLIVSNTEKLFRKVNDDIKSFTILMHDACVRFYQLDAKQSDGEINECLYNLVTSLVLKTPVYADVHILIQIMHKQKVLKIAQTIEALRKNYDIEKELGISPVKMGRAILRNKYRLAEMEDAESLMGPEATSDPRLDAEFRKRINTDDVLAREAFNEVAYKIELVRKTSSPILKVIKFARAMEDLMAVDTCAGEVQAADDALPLIFYLIVTMKTGANQLLGSRFLEEYTYVEEYCYEDQQIMQEFCNYMHLSTALEQLQLGEKACYRAFLAPDDAVFSDDEDQMGGNTRMSMRASMRMNSRASIRASVAQGRRSMAVERKLSAIPEDAQTFEELFSEAAQLEQKAEEPTPRPSSKSRLMQRLTEQGVFEPTKTKEQDSDHTPGEPDPPLDKSGKRKFVPPMIVQVPDKNTSVAEVNLQEEVKNTGSMTESQSTYLEPQDVAPVALQQKYPASIILNSNSLKNSLGGKMQMQSIGGQTSSTIASSQYKSTLASSKLNSTAQGVNLSSVNEHKAPLQSNKLGGLMPIEEEEQVKVEEGCDFELDANSRTIQNIRISDAEHSNGGSNKHNSGSPKSDQLIKSSVIQAELFKDLDQQKNDE